MSRTSRQEDARCSSFGTAEEQGRIAATLTRVNVKVHGVARDGGSRYFKVCKVLLVRGGFKTKKRSNFGIFPNLC